MRAWVAVAAFLALVSAAAAESAATSAVPPLAEGESAPADAPNYFDRRELGAATLAALAACQDAVARASPELAEGTKAAYCGCFADAARWNIRVGRPVDPTEPQLASCAKVANGQASPPYSRVFAKSTASIASTFETCLANVADDAPAGYGGLVCSCATNAWIADGARASKLAEDLARCAVAVRYREDTGQNATLRQFGAIRVAQSPARPGLTAPAQPSPGEFIPYSGNGGGPTLCSDGMYSHSSGRGTCSHHGGIAGGRHRRR
jgi:hypothetical protein